MSASLRRDSKALGYRTRSCERREIARRRAEPGSERRRSSSVSDDEVGGFLARLHERLEN